MRFSVVKVHKLCYKYETLFGICCEIWGSKSNLCLEIDMRHDTTWWAPATWPCSYSSMKSKPRHCSKRTWHSFGDLEVQSLTVTLLWSQPSKHDPTDKNEWTFLNKKINYCLFTNPMSKYVEIFSECIIKDMWFTRFFLDSLNLSSKLWSEIQNDVYSQTLCPNMTRKFHRIHNATSKIY